MNRVVALVFTVFISFASLANVQSVQVTKRTVIPAYDDIPALEKLEGVVTISLQPTNPYNTQIVDLDSAPFNDAGNASARANFVLLQPLSDKRRNNIGLIDIPVNGKKQILQVFNGAEFDGTVDSPKSLGNGFLQKQGYSLLWIGWQHDINENSGYFYADIPKTLPERNISGNVRFDWVVDTSVKTLTLNYQGVQTPYQLDKKSDRKALLTRRKEKEGTPVVIADDKWKFSAGNTQIVAETEFDGGYIYELIFPSKDPYITGIGMAIIRDVAGYGKFNANSPFKFDKTIAFGQQQAGRFLRHFIYQGFNVTEDGRRAIDGMVIHGAGAGRGSFNHRFAQPARGAQDFESFFFPTDLYPFTGAPQQHPLLSKNEGLLDKTPQGAIPKIFYIHNGYDYWNRAAALTHIDLQMAKDVSLLDNERIYHFSAAQGYQASYDLMSTQPEDDQQYRGSMLDYHYYLKSLLVKMTNWVKDNSTPPESVFPTIKDESLVTLNQYKQMLPSDNQFVPAPHSVVMLDFGQDWDRGIVTQQPPRKRLQWNPLVPAIDNYGNEVGGIIHPLVRVPLATHLPWNLRGTGYAPQHTSVGLGTTIPFPNGLVTQLYKDKQEYLKKVALVCQSHVNQGYLLADDVDTILKDAFKLWDWVEIINTPEKTDS